MAGLGETDRGSERRRLLVLAGGIGALLAGLLAVTAGAARLGTTLLAGTGLPTEAARQISIATVSTLPPIVLGGVLIMTQPQGRGRLVGLGGVAIALTGVAIGLPLGFEAALPVVGFIYATGIFFVLASLLVESLGGSLPTGQAGPRMGRDAGASFYRSSGSEVLPADGGNEDDDLDFLLETEDDEE